MYEHGEFSGKTALITGATRGIGRVLVERFVASGAHVLAAGRAPTALAELRARFGVETLSFDLAVDASTAEVATRLRTDDVPVDILVNCAGIYTRGELKDLDIGELEHVMKVNFTNTVRLTQGVYDGMRRRGRGKIVNLSSLSGKRGYAGGTAYTASKFALVAFTQCLALEAIGAGIQVNAVCPGFVETDMADEALRARAQMTGQTADAVRAARERAIPAGRLATPDEVAAVVLFLCGPESDYIVGQAWNVDGGQYFG